MSRRFGYSYEHVCIFGWRAWALAGMGRRAMAPNARGKARTRVGHVKRALFAIAIALMVAGCGASDYIVPGDPAPTDGGARHDASADLQPIDGAEESDVLAIDATGADAARADAARADAITSDMTTSDLAVPDVSMDGRGDADVSMDAPAIDSPPMPDTGSGVPDVKQDTIDPPLDPPMLGTHRLTTRGDVLIDQIGRTVILRGVNISGRSKMPPFLPFEMADAGTISAQADKLMSWVRTLGASRFG
jgi:hypothetical protein